MSLIKSMTAGVSGLRSFQAKLNTIGNNIANVETTGFRSSSLSFSEVLSQQSGMGVRVSSMNRDFSQGSIDITGKKTDLALDGNGFFMVDSGEGPHLTRAGSFIFDKNGFLVDRSGRNVMGFNSENFQSPSTSGTLSAVRVDFDRVMDPKTTQNVFIGGNLNATASTFQQLLARTALTLGDGAMAQGSTRLNDLAQTTDAFDGSETITFNFKNQNGDDLNIAVNVQSADATLDDILTAVNSELENEQARMRLQDGLLVVESLKPGQSQLALTDVGVSGGTGDVNFPSFRVATEGVNGTKTIESIIYDSRGNSHTVVFELTQSDRNIWNYEISFNGAAQVLGNSSGTLEFDDNGNLVGETNISLEYDPNNGAAPQVFTINLGGQEGRQGLSQFSGASSATQQGQDGFGIGRLRDFNFDDFGNIIGLYDNDQEVVLARLAIGDVKNYDGLRMAGEGIFMATEQSGGITFSVASEQGDLRVLSGMLEGSNVDLTREFTEMITAQRAFQSNARVVSTSDEILNETVNLKR